MDRVRSMTESERKSCRVVNPSRATGEGKEKGREERVGLSDTGKSHSQLVCHPRLDEVGSRWSLGRDDHRSIRTGEGNEGGLERVISQVYIWWNERIRSCGRSCCDYCAFWIFEEFYSKLFRGAVDKTWFKSRVSLSLCLSLCIQDKFRRVEWKLIDSWISSTEYYSRFTSGSLQASFEKLASHHRSQSPRAWSVRVLGQNGGNSPLVRPVREPSFLGPW